MEGFEDIKITLAECQQSHLLKYWDELKEDDQKEFLKELKAIDFKEALNMYEKAQKDFADAEKVCEDDMEPINIEVESDLPNNVLDDYRNLGLQEMSNGSIAVIVLAGGQGTRLGLPFPKGMCPTGIPSGKTLFQIQAERIRRLQSLAKERTGKESKIYWYLMTSEATDMLTEKYLKQNRYFGLDKDNVRLFKQAQIPCFDLEGKILLEEKDGVALAPDGNGGMYRALKHNGILEEMEQKGIKYVHVHSVDNILVKVADPIFIGKCIKDLIDCGVKVVKKNDPLEPLGIICQIEGQYQVVEYSEITKETAAVKDQDGRLVFSAGNICNHFFTVEFLKKIAYEHEDTLRLHIAKKIVTQVGPEGDKIRPPFHNCQKLEKFIFDVLHFSKKLLAWQVDRKQEFSPVKNCDVTQKDCFSTAKKDLLALHKTWIENVGGETKGQGLEVSPLLSYAGEGLEKVKGRGFEEEEVLLSEEEEKQREKGC